MFQQPRCRCKAGLGWSPHSLSSKPLCHCAHVLCPGAGDSSLNADWQVTTGNTARVTSLQARLSLSLPRCVTKTLSRAKSLLLSADSSSPAAEMRFAPCLFPDAPHSAAAALRVHNLACCELFLKDFTFQEPTATGKILPFHTREHGVHLESETLPGCPLSEGCSIQPSSSFEVAMI